jgi:hypothetical protein
VRLLGTEAERQIPLLPRRPHNERYTSTEATPVIGNHASLRSFALKSVPGFW